MSDESTGTPDTGTTEAPETETAPASEPTRVEDFPQAAQKMIRELRDESAKHRQKAKTSADEAKATAQAEHDTATAKLAEEKAELEAQRADAVRDVARLKAAVKVGISADSMDDFVSRLRGDTDEEIQADAEALAEHYATGRKPERKSDPSQGASGSVTDVGPGMARLRHAYTAQ